MSFNQSRAERSDSSQYRRSGRSGSSAQQRNFSGGAADAPVGVSVNPTADMSTQKSPQAVPKAPSSQPTTVNSDSTAPATPAKASGEASKSFTLQFGSISPGFMNGMQIPAPTNSAPPNLDEQQCDQARHDSLRTVPAFPIPSVPKKQMPRKDGDAGDQSNTGEAHQTSKVKRSLGIGIGPQFAQHQAGKFGAQRITVKITDPRTHEELRLVSSGPRSNANVPQSQPITSVSPAHPITYYANSYNPNSLYFPAPSSVSLTGTQINPSSEVPRFSSPVSQSTPTLPVVNPSAHNSYSGKSSAPSASVQITVKQAAGSHVAKIADSSESITGTSSMNLKQVLVDAAQNDVEKARQSKPEPDDWELLKSLLQSWTLD